MVDKQELRRPNRNDGKFGAELTGGMHGRLSGADDGNADRRPEGAQAVIPDRVDEDRIEPFGFRAQPCFDVGDLAHVPVDFIDRKGGQAGFDQERIEICGLDIEDFLRRLLFSGATKSGSDNGDLFHRAGSPVR